MSRRTSRRAFLGGVGAAAITLPFWRVLRGEAQPPAFPKRLLLVFSPNGTWPDEFFPGGGERDFTLGRILAPLEAHRDRLLILGGVDQSITETGPGDGHQKGMGCLWTGKELLPGDVMGGCEACPPVSWSSGMSVDQRVALEIGGETRFRSLELGVDNGNAENVWTRMIYRGAGEPLPPEDDPHAAFERVFGDLGADPLGAERRRTLRQRQIRPRVATTRIAWCGPATRRRRALWRGRALREPPHRRRRPSPQLLRPARVALGARRAHDGRTAAREPSVPRP